jgi:hypothetical protein
MNDLIARLWEEMRNAGLPEVMLYLSDGSASRCHWDETALLGSERVALLADQERNIVRILPLSTCSGIGVASPKGIDASGFRRTVHQKLERAATPKEPTE